MQRYTHKRRRGSRWFELYMQGYIDALVTLRFMLAHLLSSSARKKAMNYVVSSMRAVECKITTNLDATDSRCQDPE